MSEQWKSLSEDERKKKLQKSIRYLLKLAQNLFDSLPEEKQRHIKCHKENENDCYYLDFPGGCRDSYKRVRISYFSTEKEDFDDVKYGNPGQTLKMNEIYEFLRWYYCLGANGICIPFDAQKGIRICGEITAAINNARYQEGKELLYSDLHEMFPKMKFELSY